MSVRLVDLLDLLGSELDVNGFDEILQMSERGRSYDRSSDPRLPERGAKEGKRLRVSLPIATRRRPVEKIRGSEVSRNGPSCSNLSHRDASFLGDGFDSVRRRRGSTSWERKETDAAKVRRTC